MNKSSDGNEPQVARFFSAKASLRGLVTSAGVVACAATAAGFCGRLGWFPDLFSHFRVQYLLGLGAVAALMLAWRRARTAAVFLFFAACNLAAIAPLYLGRTGTGFDANEPVLRVMLMNINSGSRRPDLVRAAISNARPDILVLEEITDTWLVELAVLLKTFPYSSTEPRDDNFGIALFSKVPLVSAATVYFADAEVPSVVARAHILGTNLNLVATHPPPPAGREYSGYRNRQIEAIAGEIRGMNGPVILLGDLNATPWNRHFLRLLRKSGLRDTAAGFGVHPTWPTHNPFLRIPIDHCLCSPGLVVRDRKVGQYVGSDHYPLVVDLSL